MAMAKPQWYPGSWADEVERADQEAAAARAALEAAPFASERADQTVARGHQTEAELKPSAFDDHLARTGSRIRSGTADFAPANDKKNDRSSSAMKGRDEVASSATCPRSPLLPTPVDFARDGNAFMHDGKKRGMPTSAYRQKKKRNDGSLAVRDRSLSVERPSLTRSASCHSPAAYYATDRDARCPSRGSGFGRFVAAFGGTAAATKAHPKVNPFGDAKPREVLLAERGLDWRQLDLKLEQRIDNRKESAEDTTRKDKSKPRTQHQDKENKRRESPLYRAREPKDHQDLQNMEKGRTLEEKRWHRPVSAPRRFPQTEWSKLEPAQVQRTTLVSDRANYAPILHERPNVLSDCRAKELERFHLSQKYSQVEAHNIAGMHPHSQRTDGIERYDPSDMRGRVERRTLSQSVKRVADFLCRKVTPNERMFAAREQHTGASQQLFHEIQPHVAFQLSGHYPEVFPVRPDGNFYPYEAGQIRGTREVFIEANELAMSHARSRQGEITSLWLWREV